MSKRLFFIILFVAFSLSTAINAASGKVYSHQGYPYKNLIYKTSNIKIIYSEKGNELSCYVEIRDGERFWQSPTHLTTHAAFDKKPLASCLKRQLATQILAEAYES